MKKIAFFTNEEQAYLAEARQRGAKHLLEIGIAFSGKLFSIVSQREI